MKNRKLFAIITLVAFMLTMMPLMAFATSASGSSISVDDSSAKANGKDALKFILDVDGALATGEGSYQYLVVIAERSGSLSDADTITLKDGVQPAAHGAGWVAFKYGDPLQLGENTLYVTSTVAGTVALKAYVVDGWDGKKIAEVYNGSTEIIKKAVVGNGCTGKFVATSNDIDAEITITGAEDQVFKVTTDDKGNITGATGARANNGVDYYKVSMKFTKGDAKLVGEDVTISVDKNGANLNKEEATTSATGKIEFKVSANKEGTYKVTVECGTYSKELTFVFGAAQIDKVKINYTVGGTIAVDAKEKVAMMVTAYDSNGNAVSPENAIGQLGKYVIECTSAPADSSLEDENTFTKFEYDLDVCESIFISFIPDAEGTYTIKIYNEDTGVADTTTINAAEFGTIDHATISYPASTYALGEKTQVPQVKVFDKNGVKKDATVKTFSYSGVGVSAFNSSTGQVTFKNDSDYAGNEIVVSVVANNKYAASTTLTIGAEPAALTFTDATGAVGEDATVNAQVVDVNGNKTAVSAQGSYKVDVQSAIIIEKPEGATASVDASSLAEGYANLLKKGTGKVTLTSNKEGTVKANVVLKLTAKGDVTRDGIVYKANENPYVFYLSGVATANFGGVVTDDGVSSTVTLIIGSNTFVANGSAYTSDVAPYVVNGRTFVPVRAFAEATGAKVEYDAATQVITITAEGLTAQMTIGSNILTVNGETVVMDAAAAVTAEGRTVLPVRYAGQALGYDFECAYGSNGAVTSVTMFK